jgi:hypothetical protein
MEISLSRPRQVEMAGTTIPYEVVLFSHQIFISGTIFLRDQRLSDFLNDRREKKVVVRNASVSRLEDPGKVLEKTLVAILPKSGIVLAFELPQKVAQPPRFIKYPKEKFEVFLILDGMEVRGDVHMVGSLDLLQILVDSGDSFLPITNANVDFEANPDFFLRQEAVVVNTQRILFIGEMEPKDQPDAGGQKSVGDK